MIIIERNILQIGETIYNNNNISTKLGKYNGKDVVIKQIDKNMNEDSNLDNEAFILENINNKNNYIIKYFGSIIEDNKVTGIVTEYIEYDNMEKFLKKKAYSNISEVYLKKVNKILIQICLALKFLHSQGIYHNDIKTDNIMFTNGDYDEIKLIDFGCSGSKEIQSYYGTYLAPEMNNDILLNLYEKYIIKKENKTEDDFSNDKNDIFQLGFVIWELLHYPKTPFEDVYSIVSDDNENDERLYKINCGIKENVLKENIRDDIPEQYKKIINGCWEYDLFERITIDKILVLLNFKISCPF